MVTKNNNYFVFCWEDIEGIMHESDTLSKAMSSAKQYSKNHPGFEINIFGMSSIYIVDGFEKE